MFVIAPHVITCICKLGVIKIVLYCIVTHTGIKLLFEKALYIFLFFFVEIVHVIARFGLLMHTTCKKYVKCVLGIVIFFHIFVLSILFCPSVCDCVHR